MSKIKISSSPNDVLLTRSWYCSRLCTIRETVKCFSCFRETPTARSFDFWRLECFDAKQHLRLRFQRGLYNIIQLEFRFETCQRCTRELYDGFIFIFLLLVRNNISEEILSILYSITRCTIFRKCVHILFFVSKKS